MYSVCSTSNIGREKFRMVRLGTTPLTPLKNIGASPISRVVVGVPPPVGAWEQSPSQFIGVLPCNKQHARTSGARYT